MKTIAIMQPYFLPYLGYFSLIKKSDLFILFDTPQFIRHGWIERNQVLSSNSDKIYIRAPLQKHSQKTAICDIKIRENEEWKSKILAQLVAYKKKAPFYNEVIDLLNDIFRNDTCSISEFNAFALEKVCKYLKIETPITLWSKMNLTIDKVNAPDEWALNICKKLEANVYNNPPGGQSFFDKSKYKRAGIELNFLEFKPTPYKQFGHEFVPFLSVIDAMMFCNIDEVNAMINKVKILN